MTELDFETLHAAVDRGVTAVRAVTELQPAGGPGDKVFPPTYVKDGRAETKYAFETRRIDGTEVQTVLLDSVASQANRMEEALLDGWRRGELEFPLVQVDFSDEEGLEDLGQITALQAPHRIADALLRDSLLDDKPFRYSDVGLAFTDARPNNATPMYRYCPTALVFGVWDSTGPKGGLGAKFQRAMVSEIIALNAVAGVKVSSRIDPAGIEKKAGDVYLAKDSNDWWTSDPTEAKQQKGKPVFVGKNKDQGTPAEINHGNIPPSIDAESGGVTFDKAVQTTVLSLAALRRLRFPYATDGTQLDASSQPAAEIAARTVLASLSLCALAYQREAGYDLRSRSLLVATSPLEIELVPADGGAPQEFGLSVATARGLLKKALDTANKNGIGFIEHEIKLNPAPKLSHIIRKSRELVAAGEVEDED